MFEIQLCWLKCTQALLNGFFQLLVRTWFFRMPLQKMLEFQNYLFWIPHGENFPKQDFNVFNSIFMIRYLLVTIYVVGTKIYFWRSIYLVQCLANAHT
jgi:hypothetical protein